MSEWVDGARGRSFTNRKELGRGSCTELSPHNQQDKGGDGDCSAGNVEDLGMACTHSTRKGSATKCNRPPLAASLATMRTPAATLATAHLAKLPNEGYSCQRKTNLIFCAQVCLGLQQLLHNRHACLRPRVQWRTLVLPQRIRVRTTS